jgi:hypothetical protein
VDFEFFEAENRGARRTVQVLSLLHLHDRVLSPVVCSCLVFGHRFGHRYSPSPLAQEGPGRGIGRVMRARACAAGKCGWDSPIPKNKNSGVREISSPSGFWRAGVLARALSAAVTVGAGAGGPRPCRPGRAPARAGSARRGRLQPLAEVVSPRTVGCGHVWNVARDRRERRRMVHLRSGAESSLTDHAGPLARGVGHLVCEAAPRLLHPLIDLGTGLLEPGLETRVGPHLVVDTRGERPEVLAFR